MKIVKTYNQKNKTKKIKKTCIPQKTSNNFITNGRLSNLHDSNVKKKIFNTCALIVSGNSDSPK